ncbi:MAG: glycosyl hydrolase [Candidatus Eisenbacteria bacterium]|nr:glycosyl hydrolase [Candidatus Latescibacterota bacterium]MBD3302028.1 glycosyl hydrolase [Candidatus Eisenbacteria bacterium]
MWCFGTRSPLLAGLFLLFCIPSLGGIDVDPGSGEDEDRMVLREFHPFIGDRWIGNAICYGPHRDGQWPGGPTPNIDQIVEDLQIMARHWSLLRLYGSSEFGEKVLQGIRTHDLEMKVLLGVWIAPEEKRNEQGEVLERDATAVADNLREIDAAIDLATRYPDLVAGVCVGNETQVSWSPHPGPLDILIEHVRRVRASVSVPVTAADDYQYWVEPRSRTLAGELDFITMHAHPLWNGRQLEGALPWLEDQFRAVQAVHPNRSVVIGETGWATSVADGGEQARLIQGEVGEAEQAAFYASVRRWASENRVTTFVFEAFDENWKGGDDPDEVEKHWGLYRADRTPKRAVGGEDPPPGD